MSDVIVRAENVTKHFRLLRSQRTLLLAVKAFLARKSLHMSYPVLENLSFEIRRGEKIALLGTNGAGKSTLLRLLAGILEASGGTLKIPQESSGVFAGETGLYLELSVIDNIPVFGAIHGVPRAVLKRKEEEILAVAGLGELRYALTKELSSGQRRRLALSIFFQCDHEFMILDEALTHVDAAFSKKCEEQLAKWTAEGKTFVVVSHDLTFLRRHCTRALWVSDKRLKMNGPVDEVVAAYERAQTSAV